MSGSSIKFLSADRRIELHANVSGSESAPLTVLCLHGLTRNGADFDELARHLSLRYRVITVDQRGRGKSQRDPDPTRYQPATYVQDMFELLHVLQIASVALIGTSMGGILSMMMAAAQPHRVRGIVLNDIGPEVPVEGLDRLRSSLGQPATVDSWSDAIRHARRVNDLAFPDYDSASWERFARRIYTDDPSGRPVLAYDPAILNGLSEENLSAVPANLWSLWDQIISVPMLAIRGGLSDILSAEILEHMRQRHPDLDTVVVPNRGHAPMLDEPSAMSAIGLFLGRLMPAPPVG